jgi:hypothetical protein
MGAESYNFIDFYIGYPGHPNFRSLELIEDDIVRVIVQKYEVIIFTNKGDLLGDPDFGADLTRLLHETRLSAESIESDIRSQISKYIKEIDEIEHNVTVDFFEDPERYQEYMVVNFTIAGYEVYASVK